MAGPGVGAMGGGSWWHQRVGAARALEDMMTSGIPRRCHVHLDLPWVLHEGWEAGG